MSTSTDAILFWGYCWDEGEEEGDAPIWVDEEQWEAASPDERERLQEWDTVYAERSGLPRPPDPDLNRPRGSRSDRYNYLHAYWEQKRELAEASGCDIDYHGSEGYRMPLVAIRGSKIVARRGYPKTVASLEVSPAWRPLLDRFCAVMQITPPEGQPPRWWLVSYWG